ncbi:MAG: ferritin-like domain-containing protein [Acidobacteriota bacterium]|nr:ferritin-like domain-containing protein [Acidobacteriota bacterium]
MKIPRVVPILEKERILRLFHQAQEAQWSARAISWDAPQVLTSSVSKDRMARLLTPILMSEQSAFHSASRLLPMLDEAGEAESQYYMTTWIVDEARHAELFYRLLKRFDREPLSPRRFPAAYMFHSRNRSAELNVFLSGLLIIEVLAKKAMTEFLRIDVDTALSEICEGILRDEARHLSFNRIYIEDHLAGLEASDPAVAEACGVRLTDHMESLLAGVPEFLGSMRADFDDIGFQTEMVVEELRVEARQRMERSVAKGRDRGSRAPTTS